MKTAHNKNKLAAFLLASLLISSFTACGSSTGQETSISSDEENKTPLNIAETEPETEPVPELPQKNYNGENLTILTKTEGNESGRWTDRGIYVEEITGETVNDAIYNRNSLIQQQYNCIIKQARMSLYDMPAGITDLIAAGDTQYDIIMPNCTSAASLSLSGVLYDLQDIGYVDLTKPWWNAQFTEDTIIGGKNYFANGDISETFMRATYAVFFNKQGILNYQLENPYTLVSEGKWTMEKAQEMGTVFSSDIDGDGVKNDADNIGLIVLNNQIECLYTASGEKLVQSTDDGFTFTGDTERSLAVLETIYNLYTNKEAVLCATDPTRRSAATKSLGHVEVGEKTFSEGRCLFLMGTMNNVVAMREMDTDFGILPIPKADERQENYYSYANTWAASCAAIPISAGDPEKSAILLEELAYQSREFYTPAYYEITLKTKVSRDQESAAMLDLIYERRTADLGNLFSVGDVMSGVSQLIYPEEKNTFASFMVSKETAITAKLEEMQAFCN